jgi:hypothetical protein
MGKGEESGWYSGKRNRLMRFQIRLASVNTSIISGHTAQMGRASKIYEEKK